jgi:CDP-diacylglycerol--serine O-phosphatidyltransferase
MSFDQKKFAFFLPNTFTALNMGCGFVAMMLAYQGEFYKACLLIMLGAIFDSVDGRVARLTGTQSSFGEQFDSLSDLISFGMAPAMIFYFRFLTDSGRLGILVAFMFLLCGALRLARFNANIDKVSSDYFQGLPIPSGALALIGYVLFSLELNLLNQQWLAIPYIAFYAILMISSVPFPSFKSSDWIKNHKKQVLILIFSLLGLLFIYEALMVAIIISAYVFGSLVYILFNRKKFKGIFNWPNEHEGHSGESL